jgi:hypothetical protein
MMVHLVDGTYELFRHFYGQRRFNDGQDRPCGAVVGVLNTVLEMIESGASHIGVATDHVIESFRNELYPGYKTGQGIEPALLAQFYPLEEALTAMGVAGWPMVEFEADDALGILLCRRSVSGPPTRILRNVCAATAWFRLTERLSRYEPPRAFARSSALIRLLFRISSRLWGTRQTAIPASKASAVCQHASSLNATGRWSASRLKSWANAKGSRFSSKRSRRFVPTFGSLAMSTSCAGMVRQAPF